MIDATPQ